MSEAKLLTRYEKTGLNEREAKALLADYKELRSNPGEFGYHDLGPGGKPTRTSCFT